MPNSKSLASTTVCWRFGHRSWNESRNESRLDDRQAQSIDLIAGDVEKLKRGALLKEDIVEARYTNRLELEAFDSF